MAAAGDRYGLKQTDPTPAAEPPQGRAALYGSGKGRCSRFARVKPHLLADGAGRIRGKAAIGLQGWKRKLPFHQHQVALERQMAGKLLITVAGRLFVLGHQNNAGCFPVQPIDQGRVG